MFRPRRRGHGQPGMAMWLLAFEILRFGIDRIPPVTLAAMLGQIALYLKPLDLHVPNIGEICVSAGNVWMRHEWKRLFLASFFHLNDWHLYYNMTSFLWKGQSLERKLGSKYFAFLLGVFAVLVNVVIVALSLAAERLLHDPSYLWTCAAGFSGRTESMLPHITWYDPVHSVDELWCDWVKYCNADIQLLG